MDNKFKGRCTHIFSTYARLPVAIARGQGCRLWDEDGREYLDFLAGVAVCSLGHCHPEITRAITEQANTLVHVSNLFYTRPQEQLAEELTRLSFADRVFFANSGAEANEAAIKLARKYSKDRHGDGRFHIITTNGSFHGRTLATLSATGQEKIQHGFEPLVDGFVHVDYDSIAAVEAAVTDRTCAVMVEPILGEGGVRLPAPGYLAGLRALCDERDLLFIFDEIQVGMGRTGTLFAYEQTGVTPDVMTLAKALGNGLPIGVMLAAEHVGHVLSAGSHGSTFGGTPLVAAAALRVLELISRPELLAEVRRKGEYFLAGLREMAARHRIVKEVRGRGLIIGMELTVPGQVFVTACLERGVIINCTQDNVLRFVPPLIVEQGDIDHVISTLDRVLEEKTS